MLLGQSHQALNKLNAVDRVCLWYDESIGSGFHHRQHIIEEPRRIQTVDAHGALELDEVARRPDVVQAYLGSAAA